MRRLKKYIILTSIGCAMSGCTCNNGDIGEWFGTWHLDRITIDNVTDTDYQGNIFWQFQSDVFCMLEVGEYHTYTFHWATWSEHGKTLELNYDHPRDPEIIDSHKYVPPVQVHMESGITDLTIDKLTGKKLTVTYNAPEATYQYFLNKR